VFQPHLFTRTRDFLHEFAESLSAADHVILTDIYPAREEPIPGVTSDKICAERRSLVTAFRICRDKGSRDRGGRESRETGRHGYHDRRGSITHIKKQILERLQKS